MSKPTPTLNQQAAARFGWDPSWFGADAFDGALEEAIRAYQAAEGLVVDGWAHVLTYRRMLTDRVVAGDVQLDEPTAPPSDFILYADKLLPVPWHKVVTPGEPGSLKLTRGFSGRRRPVHEIRAAIWHWDVTSSATVTRRILHDAGISTHFVIDHDGTIYQLVDLAHTAWHAGNQRINGASIGIDFNNPVRTKYAKSPKGQKKRKTLSGWRINGWDPGDFLAMHKVQLEAAVGLLAGLAAHFPALELKATSYDKPKTLARQLTLNPSTLSGCFHHAEVDIFKRKNGRYAGKWDTAGVDLVELCELARELST